ncbi:Hypothetical protein CINCED_3A022977 [Cinara cedri]|uniref:Uncharacterized protein n=1 Tax=Cinara cedri TaxID=506608 RepID=A0A5E4NFV2_9HEMI|nr:Hypothetical protein CINCED_3A022977 [Cinara cedri]
MKLANVGAFKNWFIGPRKKDYDKDYNPYNNNLISPAISSIADLSNTQHPIDIQCPIETQQITLAKQTFIKKNSLLTSKHLKIETKKKCIKTFVWSVLLYGCETWTIRKKEKDRLEAIEMWIWRKMNKTSWVEIKTNEQVLKDIQELTRLLGINVKRSIKRIFEKFFSDKLLYGYLFLDIRTKKSFSSLNICSVIIEAIRKDSIFGHIQNREIEDVIQKHLAQRPFVIKRNEHISKIKSNSM